MRYWVCSLLKAGWWPIVVSLAIILHCYFINKGYIYFTFLITSKSPTYKIRPKPICDCWVASSLTKTFYTMFTYPRPLYICLCHTIFLKNSFPDFDRTFQRYSLILISFIDYEGADYETERRFTHMTIYHTRCQILQMKFHSHSKESIFLRRNVSIKQSCIMADLTLIEST